MTKCALSAASSNARKAAWRNPSPFDWLPPARRHGAPPRTGSAAPYRQWYRRARQQLRPLRCRQRRACASAAAAFPAVPALAPSPPVSVRQPCAHPAKPAPRAPLSTSESPARPPLPALDHLSQSSTPAAQLSGRAARRRLAHPEQRSIIDVAMQRNQERKGRCGQLRGSAASSGDSHLIDAEHSTTAGSPLD